MQQRIAMRLRDFWQILSSRLLFGSILWAVLVVDVLLLPVMYLLRPLARQYRLMRACDGLPPEVRAQLVALHEALRRVPGLADPKIIVGVFAGKFDPVYLDYLGVRRYEAWPGIQAMLRQLRPLGISEEQVALACPQ